MPKCDFNRVVKITLWHGCSFINLLHIFRAPLDQNTCEELLLVVQM